MVALEGNLKGLQCQGIHTEAGRAGHTVVARVESWKLPTEIRSPFAL